MENNTAEEQTTPDGDELVEGSDPGQINPEVLQNIPVTISIEVGRASLKIRDLLRLSQGSVVELDRLAVAVHRGARLENGRHGLEADA